MLILAFIIPEIVLAGFFGRFMKRLQIKIQDSKALSATVVEESFSNVRTVKAFSTESVEHSKYGSYNNVIYRLGYNKACAYGIFMWFTQIFVYGCIIAILLVGAKLIQEGHLSIGSITAFLLYLIQLLMNFMMLTGLLGSVMAVIGASVKIVQILEHVPLMNVRGGKSIHSIEGHIEIRNLTFSYPAKQDVKILSGISLDIEKGKVIALVGQSGSGKTTIISMIERFYDPQEGGVFLDGQNIKDLDPVWYHKNVALVSQEPVLFSGSIRENIIYGLDSSAANESDMIQATKMAYAYDFITDKVKFPLGFDTLVGERGIQLSGGQKQRIAIARALVRKPKILLLDEATSALDAESEHQVQKALDDLIKNSGQTIIVIAHRLSTIRDADKIVVLQSGEIMEMGSHEELLRKGEFYKALVERQLNQLSDS